MVCKSFTTCNQYQSIVVQFFFSFIMQYSIKFHASNLINRQVSLNFVTRVCIPTYTFESADREQSLAPQPICMTSSCERKIWLDGGVRSSLKKGWSKSAGDQRIVRSFHATRNQWIICINCFGDRSQCAGRLIN